MGEERRTEHRFLRVKEGRREAWEGEGIKKSGVNHVGESKEEIVVKGRMRLPALVAAGGTERSIESRPWDKTGGFGERFPGSGGGGEACGPQMDEGVNATVNGAEESVGTQEREFGRLKGQLSFLCFSDPGACLLINSREATNTKGKYIKQKNKQTGYKCRNTSKI